MINKIVGLSLILAMGASHSALAQTSRSVVLQEGKTTTVVVDETPIYGQQIVAELQRFPQASYFSTLMATTGLAATLRDDKDGFTVFVPVNSAFRSAPNTVETPKVNSQIRQTLESHVIGEKVDTKLMHGRNDTVKSLSERKITLSKAGSTYYANGKRIIRREMTPEGIYYFVEDFLFDDSAN